MTSDRILYRISCSVSVLCWCQPLCACARSRCRQLSLSARLALVTSKHAQPCSAALGWLDLSHCAKSAITHTDTAFPCSVYNGALAELCFMFHKHLSEISLCLRLTSLSPFLSSLSISLHPPSSSHTHTDRGGDEIIETEWLYWSSGLTYCTGLLPLHSLCASLCSALLAVLLSSDSLYEVEMEVKQADNQKLWLTLNRISFFAVRQMFLSAVRSLCWLAYVFIFTTADDVISRYNAPSVIFFFLFGGIVLVAKVTGCYGSIIYARTRAHTDRKRTDEITLSLPLLMFQTRNVGRSVCVCVFLCVRVSMCSHVILCVVKFYLTAFMSKGSLSFM